jgi:hypothetical protein
MCISSFWNSLLLFDVFAFYFGTDNSPAAVMTKSRENPTPAATLHATCEADSHIVASQDVYPVRNEADMPARRNPA